MDWAMLPPNRLLETNDELFIRRFKEGLQLLSPEFLAKYGAAKHERLITVRDLLNANINVYFLDNQSIIHNINETALATTGFASLRDAIGSNRVG